VRSELFNDLPYDEGNSHSTFSYVCRYAGLDILAESWIWMELKASQYAFAIASRKARSEKHVVRF